MIVTPSRYAVVTCQVQAMRVMLGLDATVAGTIGKRQNPITRSTLLLLCEPTGLHAHATGSRASV